MRMTLTRISFLTSGFFSLVLFCLLLCGLSLPAAALSHRSHRSLTHKEAAIVLSYSTVLRGRASWYGREHQGLRTSSGERFNRFKYTCAHKSLPFGTRLRVTNIKTGKAVIVRVSDRGPFRHERILDLAEVAARPLGIVDQGAASIIAQIVPSTTPLGPAATPKNLLALQAADPNPEAAFASYQLDTLASEVVVATAATQAAPTPSPAAKVINGSASRFVVQAGSFADVQAAQAMQARILALDPALGVSLSQEGIDNKKFNRVIIDQLDNWLAAETIRRRLQVWGITGLVRQLPAQPLVAAVPTMPR
jgi:rare lipoprotein A